MTKPKVNVVGKYTPPTVGGHFAVTCKAVDVLIFRNAISSFIIQTVTGCGREGGPYQMCSISERDSLSSDNVFVALNPVMPGAGFILDFSESPINTFPGTSLFD